MKKQKDEEMKSNVRKMIYTQFINNFVKPYNIKRKEGGHYKNEEKALIEKYIKVSGDMKKLIKMELPKLWEAILNPAFMEREKRKGELKEEDIVGVRDQEKANKYLGTKAIIVKFDYNKVFDNIKKEFSK